MLQRLLEPEELRSPVWTAWFTLHGQLEEFASHLLKPAWAQFSVLHPIAQQYESKEDVAVHMSAKRDKLQGGKKAKTRAKILAGVVAGVDSLAPAGDAEVSPIMLLLTYTF